MLKVAPPASLPVLRYEHDIMTAEVETIRLVRAHTSMPAPEVLCHDPSHTLIDNEFFIMGFVAGVPFHKLRTSITRRISSASSARWATFLAEMNAISGNVFGYSAPHSPRFCGLALRLRFHAARRAGRRASRIGRVAAEL